MAKLTEYPRATSFEDGDVLLKDGISGTKIISIDDLLSSLDLAKVSRTLQLFNYSNGVTKIIATESSRHDMNNDTTPGVYRVESAGDNKYIDNGPFSSQTYHKDEPGAGFKLIVMSLNTAESNDPSMKRLIQIAFPNATGYGTSLMVFRTRSTSGWGEWQFVATKRYVEGAPYVYDEADRVADLVRSVQTPDSFTFIGISDLHYRYENLTIKNALNDMKRGILAICSQIKADCFIDFGDNIYRVGSASDFAEGKVEMIEVTKIIHDAFFNIPFKQIQLVGNHDPNSLELDNGVLRKYFSMVDLYNFFGSKSDIVRDPENKAGSYGYTDLPDKKIRIIALNTSDFTDEGKPIVKPSSSNPNLNSTSTYVMSVGQINWLIDALTMDDVSDRSEWSIMIISHIPIDLTSGNLYTNNGSFNVASLLRRYMNKQTGTFQFKNTDITYDFSFEDHAKILPLVFGHNHNYSFENLNVADAQTLLSNLVKVHVPNALPGRESGTYSYPKVSNTAKSTAFCVFVLNQDEGTLYSYHYGAGIDRIIHYNPLIISGSMSVTSALTSNLTWSTKNEGVAMVTNGTITSKNAGNTLILATDADENIEVWNVSVA